MKVTDWYTGDQKPVRVGVYERAYSYKLYILYCYWNGKLFSCAYRDLELAKSMSDYFRSSLNQNLPWRGIAK